AEFFAVASAPTALAARVGPSRPVRRPSNDYSMPLRVWVADSGAVKDATVAGYIRRPDGVKIPITLRDDGTSLDGAADDGIYGFEYIAAVKGAHYVDLKASGVSSGGDPFERYLSTSFLVPGARKKPVQFGEGLPPLIPEPPPGFDGFCGCEAEARWSFAGYGGITLPSGSFDSVADPSTSVGVKLAFPFPAPGSPWSAGLYLGHDRFVNATEPGDLELTHLSAEVEYSPKTGLCPEPSVHLGVGTYRDESGQDELGYNVGASLGLCLSPRVKLLTRYDYRAIDDLDRDYSTLQMGLRFSF
ncbi:MAG: choice-of-anchor X domain-containing protein, partial [Acidobacteriota bacterium]